MSKKNKSNKNIKITNLYINSVDDIVTLVREIGTDVKRITLTIEEAKKIGLINLKVIEKI